MAQPAAQYMSGGLSRTFTAATPDDILKPGLAARAPTATDDVTQNYSVGSIWENTSTAEVWVCRSATAGAARWTKLATANHPGYVAGNYYLPLNYSAPVAGLAASAAGRIYLSLIALPQRITISQLGVRISTSAAGGNFALAIYNHNSSAAAPSTLVATTPAGSTASAAIVNIALNSNQQLESGFYWLAEQADNTSVLFLSQVVQSQSFMATVGSSGGAIPAGTSNASQTTGYDLAGTFGTWPSDLTGASLTLTTQGHSPIIQFLVASVP